MGRIIVLILIGVVLLLVVRSFIRSLRKPDEAPPANTARGEDMVTCSRCGVNLPRSDTVEASGKPVCRENPHCKVAP